MLIIDRFEGEFAIVESGEQTFEIPTFALPSTVQEGDVIKIIINKDATKKLKEEIDELADDIFE